VGFDKEKYGTLLYGLRFIRGYRNAEDLAAAVSAYVPTKKRTIWAIERGDQEAGIARHMAFERLLKPTDGYFDEALTLDSEDAGGADDE